MVTKESQFGEKMRTRIDDNKADAIDQFYLRTDSVNPKSGRIKQLLSCLICKELQTSRLSNMKEHIRNHLRLQLFSC